MPEQRQVVTCAGVIVDGIGRRVYAGGRMLPVHGVSYSEGHPELVGSYRVRDEWMKDALVLVYGGEAELAAACKKPIPAMPEAIHFHVVCENSWWLEVSLWLEDDEMTVDTGSEEHSGEQCTVEELLAMLAEVGNRPVYVPGRDGDLYDDAWFGLAPGRWIDTDFTPSEGWKGWEVTE